MSTSAESAQTWIKEKQPSNDEILSVIEKLENRIDKWTGDEIDIQGSIDAVIFLQSQLKNTKDQTSETEPSPNESLDLSALNTDTTVNLDASNLIPEMTPVELEADVKQAAFLALKAQLEKK
jgi:hypothetical protein